MRSGGPLLYGNHIISEVAIMGIVTWRMTKDSKHAFKWLALGWTIVPIHEFILYTTDYILSYPHGDFYFNGSLGADKYLIELAAILIVGILVAKRKEKKRIALVAGIFTLYAIIWVSVLIGFDIGRITIEGFAHGPDFFNPIPNAFEVGSWILVSSLWLRPPK